MNLAARDAEEAARQRGQRAKNSKGKNEKQLAKEKAKSDLLDKLKAQAALLHGDLEAEVQDEKDMAKVDFENGEIQQAEYDRRVAAADARLRAAKEGKAVDPSKLPERPPDNPAAPKQQPAAPKAPAPKPKKPPAKAPAKADEPAKKGGGGCVVQ